MASIEVFDPDLRFVQIIPMSCIVQMPHKWQQLSRYVLCRNFGPRRSGCRMGRFCKFVHANAPDQKVLKTETHVNYSWRSFDSVSYKRLPPGSFISVAEPNFKEPIHMLRSEMLLLTAGAVAAMKYSGFSSHCAHFRLQGVCKFGSQCQFIHAVYCDPNAQPMQLAPKPMQMAPNAQPVQLTPKPMQPFQVSSPCLDASQYNDVHSEQLNDFAGCPLQYPACNIDPSAVMEKNPMFINCADCLDSSHGGGNLIEAHDSTPVSLDALHFKVTQSPISTGCTRFPVPMPNAADIPQQQSEVSPSERSEDSGVHHSASSSNELSSGPRRLWRRNPYSVVDVFVAADD